MLAVQAEGSSVLLTENPDRHRTRSLDRLARAARSVSNAASGQGDQALAQLGVSRICRIRSRTLSLRLSAHYASFFRFGFRLIIRSRLRLVLDDHASVNQSLSCLPR